MFQLREWTFEFHGHRCPFMPIGYRMGTVALQKLSVEKSLDHQCTYFQKWESVIRKGVCKME